MIMSIVGHEKIKASANILKIIEFTLKVGQYMAYKLYLNKPA